MDYSLQWWKQQLKTKLTFTAQSLDFVKILDKLQTQPTEPSGNWNLKQVLNISHTQQYKKHPLNLEGKIEVGN